MRGAGRRAAGIAGALCALLAPSLARASHAATWWVESTCEGARASFEREITLACDAVGGTCRVVPRKSDAELVARLECAGPGAPWVLDTQTSDGKALGRLELAGTEDDRLREAAMEVARDAAPERTLAIEALQSNLSDADGKPKVPASRPFVSIAGSALGSIRGSQRNLFGGARAAIALRLVDSLHLVGAGSYAGGTGSDGFPWGSISGPVEVLRGGAGLAYGAPFDSSVFGVGLEAGFDRMWGQAPVLNARTPVSVPASSGRSYVEPSLYIQIPLRSVRPFATVGVGIMNAIASIDTQIGVAVPVF